MCFVCFSRMSHHHALRWWDIPGISKQDSDKFRKSYKYNKKHQLHDLLNQLALLWCYKSLIGFLGVMVGHLKFKTSN